LISEDLPEALPRIYRNLAAELDGGDAFWGPAGD